MTASKRNNWLPRFSLREMLLAVAFVGIGCYALRWASPFWSNLLFYVTLLLVMAGTLIAINWPGEPRSFWVGFVLCGVTHWALVFHPGFDHGFPGPFSRTFITRVLSEHAYQRIRPHLTVNPRIEDIATIRDMNGHRWGRQDPHRPDDPNAFAVIVAARNGYFYSNRAETFNVHEEDFVAVGDYIWTILLAYLGAQISLLIYRTRSAKADDAADNHG